MIAGSTVAGWLDALSGRSPLFLSPSDARGWFGGRNLIAFDPVDEGVLPGAHGDALVAAGEVLERAFLGASPRLAAALVPYSGDTRWAVYERGFELDLAGRWRPWGSEPASGWPQLGAAAGALAATQLPAATATAAPTATQPPAAGATARPLAPLATATGSTLDERAFRRAVEATREAILRGDVYVLNLTRTVTARTESSVDELFAGLCERAPAAMAAAWLPASGPAVLSASPERFVRVRGHEAQLAPVKGTRPRGATDAEDAALRAQLAESPKELAEHVMIVDLERNDLGRVCVPGSIRVDPLCEVESTCYCHQMVSRVRGLLRPEASLGELLTATFPCGSITGAPKVAAMRIAEQLEAAPRGSYTGALLVAMPGELDSSVLIRTAEARQRGGNGAIGTDAVGCDLTYGTGCGITVDSDAGEEWLESVLKTHPLLGTSGR